MLNLTEVQIEGICAFSSAVDDGASTRGFYVTLFKVIVVSIVFQFGTISVSSGFGRNGNMDG